MFVGTYVGCVRVFVVVVLVGCTIVGGHFGYILIVLVVVFCVGIVILILIVRCVTDVVGY